MKKNFRLMQDMYIFLSYDSVAIAFCIQFSVNITQNRVQSNQNERYYPQKMKRHAQRANAELQNLPAFSISKNHPGKDTKQE